MALPEGTGAQWGLIQPARITEGITGGVLRSTLNDAATEAGQLIQFHLDKGNISGKMRAAQLQRALGGIQALNTDLWNEVERVTRGGMYQAAQLAADQSLDLDLFIGMPGGAVMQYAELTHWNATQAVNDLISRHEHGYVLADRIYANGKVSTEQVGRIVDRALLTQQGSRELARSVRNFYRPDVPGGVSYASMRLARTEINNAHHHTTIAMSKDQPWVHGFKWNLSRSHPKPDPCDDLATQNSYDMGEGVYPKEQAPDRPHPQCLCYLTHAMEDEEEFMNKLVGGQYDEHLAGRGVTC